MSARSSCKRARTSGACWLRAATAAFARVVPHGVSAALRQVGAEAEAAAGPRARAHEGTGVHVARAADVVAPHNVAVVCRRTTPAGSSARTCTTRCPCRAPMSTTLILGVSPTGDQYVCMCV